VKPLIPRPVCSLASTGGAGFGFGGAGFCSEGAGFDSEPADSDSEGAHSDSEGPDYDSEGAGFLGSSGARFFGSGGEDERVTEEEGSPGPVIISPHLGQGPVADAAEAGTERGLLQKGQLKSIESTGRP
jgi:hypothetical protein